MEDHKEFEKSLLEKIQGLLERKPEHYDVTFCVGKEKKIVKALKIILKASSPFLEKEFEDKWELAVIAEGEGIPLPDFDPMAFELFVKLTSQDTWSLDILKALNLPPNQILDLLSICRSFEMEKSAENLEILAATFILSFGEFKDTDDFLQLSQTNLKSVLVSDDIGIKELDVFQSAVRWAEFQCTEMEVEPTEEHIREVLGDCLFEVRFPIMSNTEFTEATEEKDILTAEETVWIYKYIGSAASKKLVFDAKKLSFKTIQRRHILVHPGLSRICLKGDFKIVENPPTVCDGIDKSYFFQCGTKITLYGLGFMGPIENDGFYVVKVLLEGQNGIVYNTKMLEKRIFAQKGKKFYFFFNAPIDLEASPINSKWTDSTYYRITCCFKGPNTSAFSREVGKNFVLQEADAKFQFQLKSNELAEILFKVC